MVKCLTPNSPILNYLGKISLLALLYIVTGKLGLLLAVPPGYATVIWPPSGIAIGVLMLYGWRLWPGVLIGSFILNCYISQAFSTNDGFIIGKTLIALCIAVGSTLQALVGRLMVSRFIGLPLALKQVKEMFLLFLVSGPVACLVAASIGISTLYLSGVLPADKIIRNWITWWAGDTFGVIVFLPLLLIAPSNSHKLTWRGNNIGALPVLAMLALIMPLGLTFYAWKITSENAYQQSFSRFTALAQESEGNLLHRMDSYNYALLGGAGFIEGSQFVSREEWRNYVGTLDIKNSFPGMNGMGLVVPVEPNNLFKFLKEIHKDNIQNFIIHPETVSRPLYVIKYVGPENKNIAALGLNIAFENNRLEAANIARDTGKSAITKRIILVQDIEKKPGFLLLHPVYEPKMSTDTIQERQKALIGWIYAPFIAKNFLNDLTKSQGDTLNIKIYDGDKESPENLIYNSDNQNSVTTEPVFTVIKQLDIMQQKWLVVWSSTPAYEKTEHNDNPLFVMVGGLLFTGLFGVFLMMVAIRRTETMEWMVEEHKYVLPASIFIVIALSSLYLYNSLKQKEESFVKGIIEEESKKIELLLLSQTNDKLLALKRMAQRWESAGGTPEKQWQEDAANYTNQLKGLKTIEWVDSTYYVRWAEPLKGNEAAIGLNILFDKEREKALKGATEIDSITLTPPLDLVQGYKAFIAYAPIKINGRFNGFMVGIFAIDEFFTSALTTEAEYNYTTSLQSEGKVFFKHGADERLDSDLTVQRTLSIYDKQWVLSITPTNKFVKSQLTSLPLIILIAGLIIAVLLALTIRYILISRIRSGYLADSNRLNTAVLSSSAYLIIATDENGKVIVFNKAAETSLGYSSQEIIGKQTPAIWHDEDEVINRARELSIEFGKNIEPGFDVFTYKARLDGAESHEWTFIRKDGSTFPGNLTATPLISKNGEITGYLGVVENITRRILEQTERMLQQQALETSEETFRSAMEHASIGMALVSTTGRWLKVNKALCDSLGYDKEDLLANDFQSITHPDDLEQDLEYVRQVLEGEINTYQMEKRYYHHNGRIIWALLNVSLVKDGFGTPNYFIAQIQDITEQKEIERMKSEFISIVSHELRTPLTSIRGSLGLMIGTMAKDIPEKANRLIEIAHKNSERLILLINDILDIDKVASGQMRFDMKPEFLGNLIHQAVDANQSYAEKFGVTIAPANVNAELEIKVDSARFIQVLSNLLSNAAKFSPQNGKILVVVSKASKNIRISVTDSGPGIAEEFRSRIFGKFSQADSSVTRSKGGTGLGLHISKQMVEHMNGTIGFDTEIGKGSTFWVEFPLLQPDNADDSHHGAEILICEDNTEIAALMQTMLEHAGFQADIVHNIPETKRMLKNKRYAAVTIDLILPMGDGMDLIHELREDPHTANLPVIIVSAKNKPHTHDKSIGIVDWLEKPIDEARLIRSLRQAIADSGKMPKILHVEDDLDLSNVLATALNGKAEIINAATLKQAERLLTEETFKMVILDIGMPDGSGLTLIKRINPSIPILILTAIETNMEVQQQVEAVMVKSRVSETKIIETIVSFINQQKDISHE
jgi:PAS domain S-box-containing protein